MRTVSQRPSSSVSTCFYHRLASNEANSLALLREWITLSIRDIGRNLFSQNVESSVVNTKLQRAVTLWCKDNFSCQFDSHRLSEFLFDYLADLCFLKLSYLRAHATWRQTNRILPCRRSIWGFRCLYYNNGLPKLWGNWKARLRTIHDARVHIR